MSRTIVVSAILATGLVVAFLLWAKSDSPAVPDSDTEPSRDRSVEPPPGETELVREPASKPSAAPDAELFGDAPFDAPPIVPHDPSLATVEVRTVDPQDRPVADVQVILFDVSDVSSVVSTQLVTDSEGLAKFVNVQPGLYSCQYRVVGDSRFLAELPDDLVIEGAESLEFRVIVRAPPKITGSLSVPLGTFRAGEVRLSTQGPPLATQGLSNDQWRVRYESGFDPQKISKTHWGSPPPVVAKQVLDESGEFLFELTQHGSKTVDGWMVSETPDAIHVWIYHQVLPEELLDEYDLGSISALPGKTVHGRVQLVDPTGAHMPLAKALKPSDDPATARITIYGSGGTPLLDDCEIEIDQTIEIHGLARDDSVEDSRGVDVTGMDVLWDRVRPGFRPAVGFLRDQIRKRRLGNQPARGMAIDENDSFTFSIPVERFVRLRFEVDQPKECPVSVVIYAKGPDRRVLYRGIGYPAAASDRGTSVFRLDVPAQPILILAHTELEQGSNHPSLFGALHHATSDDSDNRVRLRLSRGAGLALRTNVPNSSGPIVLKFPELGLTYSASYGADGWARVIGLPPDSKYTVEGSSHPLVSPSAGQTGTETVILD